VEGMRPSRLACAVSLAAYLLTFSAGVRTLTFPWSAPYDDDTARLMSWALPAFVAQYLAESLAAYSAHVVTMHGWAPADVMTHHLAAASLLAPAILIHLWRPLEWQPFMQRYTPLSAIASSSFLTSVNEAAFVVRALLPSDWADAPAVNRASNLLTLCVLCLNVPILLLSCVVGTAIATDERGVLTTCVHDPCPNFGQLRRAVILVAHWGAAIFALRVQTLYMRSNLRKLLWPRNGKATSKREKVSTS
jgi:hypothetical protein